MTSRSARTESSNSDIDELLKQPAAYPVQTEYYVLTPGVGMQQVHPRSSSSSQMPATTTTTTPAQAPPVPQPATVVVQTPSGQVVCCSTAHMGYHTHDMPSTGGRETLATERSSVTSSTVEQTSETVTVQGESGVLMNRTEIVNFSGPVPLNDYPINEDPNPEVIRRKADPPVIPYVQEVSIRYLRPPTPPPPGDIIIRQDRAFLPPPAPPIIIRQQPLKPESPPPLVIRERPPVMPMSIPTKVITVAGRRLPPPPRRVIIERLPKLPPPPQPIIVERWLNFGEMRRRVVFTRHPEPDPYVEKPRNQIVQWETPQVSISREYFDLGIVRANPDDYVARYGPMLKDVADMPDFVRDIRPPSGLALASDMRGMYRLPELEGDLFALSMIDLEREGLGEYRGYLERLGRIAPSIQQSRSFESTYSEGFLGRRKIETQPMSTRVPQTPLTQAQQPPTATTMPTQREKSPTKEVYATVTVVSTTMPTTDVSTSATTGEKRTPSMTEGSSAGTATSTTCREEGATTSTRGSDTTGVVGRGSGGTTGVSGGSTLGSSRVGTTGETTQGDVITGDKSTRDEVQAALRQVMDKFQPRTQNRLSFAEAKEVIRLLNEKLGRVFEESQTEKFLERVKFKRDDQMSVEAFTIIILDNV